MTAQQGHSWLVFGDDWGRHPSTTQHLIRQLLDEDTVYWIGSIGMRAPTLKLTDIKRVFEKLWRRPHRASEAQAETGACPRLVSVLLLPWHGWAPVRMLNRWLLRRALRRAGAPEHFDVLLSANPLVAAYAEAIDHQRLAYLRLDDYAHLPGVNPHWVARFEPQMIARAQCNLATARGLLAGSGVDVYLPQGVELERFSGVPLQPPEGRCIGFFGLMESWLDHQLIAEVARRHPDWDFEFIGHAPVWPDWLDAIPNIRRRPAVDYDRLTQAITHWRGAWVPFAVNELTLAVNPIKLREYLAAGLPALSTPLPESRALRPWAWIADDVDSVALWLEQQVLADSEAMRSARRQEMRGHSWRSRALQMRAAILASPQ